MSNSLRVGTVKLIHQKLNIGLIVTVYVKTITLSNDSRSKRQFSPKCFNGNVTSYYLLYYCQFFISLGTFMLHRKYMEEKCKIINKMIPKFLYLEN